MYSLHFLVIIMATVQSEMMAPLSANALQDGTAPSVKKVSGKNNVNTQKAALLILQDLDKECFRETTTGTFLVRTLCFPISDHVMLFQKITAFNFKYLRWYK